MKKLLLPLLAAVAISFTAAAQAGPPQDGGRPRQSPQEMASQQASRLTKDVGLSADQSTNVQQIFAARAQEMQAQRTEGRARPTREQRQATRAKYDDQLKQVLTPDQFAKYTAREATRRQHGPGGPELKDGKLKAKEGKVKIKAKPTES